MNDSSVVSGAVSVRPVGEAAGPDDAFVNAEAGGDGCVVDASGEQALQFFFAGHGQAFARADAAGERPQGAAGFGRRLGFGRRRRWRVGGSGRTGGTEFDVFESLPQGLHLAFPAVETGDGGVVAVAETVTLIVQPNA